MKRSVEMFPKKEQAEQFIKEKGFKTATIKPHVTDRGWSNYHVFAVLVDYQEYIEYINRKDNDYGT